MDEIMVESSAYLNFTLHNGQLLYKGRLELAPDSKGTATVLQWYHHSNEGDIQGISRFISAFVEIFGGREWSGILNNILQLVIFVNKTNQNQWPHPDSYKPIQVQKKIWTNIFMDFIDGPPPSKGKAVIFVVVDRLNMPISLLYLILILLPKLPESSWKMSSNYTECICLSFVIEM